MSIEAAPIEAAATEGAQGLEAALDVLRGRRIAVLTGAGVSTDSGIPDYRGEGSPRRTPMTVQQFLGTDESRARYWAGSHLGWRRFGSATPNDGHRALAELETAGVTNGVITQNVDGLHRRAGSRRVVELHGSMDAVRCLHCGQRFSRAAVARRLDELNPGLGTRDPHELRPDGDVDPGLVDGFAVPACTVCSGTLKPDVVFFGETVPLLVFRAASSLVASADALLIVGSSLAVNSGIRLLDAAVRAGKPVVILGRGPTKGDVRATVRVEAGATESLRALAEALTA